MTTWVTEQEDTIVGGVSESELKRDEEVSLSLTHRQLQKIGEGKVNPLYKIKASLVLVDSDKEEWGIVEDTNSDLAWEPGKGEIVGTWARTKHDRLIYFSLCTSIQALQDRAVQTFAQYAEKRRTKDIPKKRAPTVKGAAKKAEPEPEQPATELSFEKKLEFNSLRAKLGRAK